jgi:hypothetical protein
MADFQYDPVEGWENETEFPDYPLASEVRPLFQRLFNQIRDVFNTHKAETVSNEVGVSRDISLTGVQTVSLPFKAKSIIALVVMPTKSFSWGIWAENNVQRCITMANSNGNAGLGTSIIKIDIDGTNYATGTIQNVTASGFEILWAKTEAPTGAATVYMLASTH